LSDPSVRIVRFVGEFSSRTTSPLRIASEKSSKTSRSAKIYPMISCLQTLDRGVSVGWFAYNF